MTLLIAAAFGLGVVTVLDMRATRKRRAAYLQMLRDTQRGQNQ